MKKFLFSVLFLLCAPSYAQTEYIESLIKETYSLYNGTAPYKEPIIKFVTDQEIDQFVCDGKCPFNVIGIYINDVIYMRNNWDADSDIQASYFVHEMVHFLQHENNKLTGSETCVERHTLEFEAYRIQNLWLLKRNKQIPYILLLRLTDLSSHCN